MPLERVKNNTLAIGSIASMIAWIYFLFLPYWQTPWLLCLATISTSFTLLTYSIYELPFLKRPATKIGNWTSRRMVHFLPASLLIIRFFLVWCLFLVFFHIFQQYGFPKSNWFRWSFFSAVPLIGFRRVLSRLYEGYTDRRSVFFLETARLLALFSGISLFMAYINGMLFAKQAKTGSMHPLFLVFWVPAVLTLLANVIMYFDAILGISEKRKR